ncbi:hypothetical protein BDB00DRAFT_280788 [Zychaea mexicana]|uniref:uncharacterized protein n=1 Tax=Zychaea mexicana TaxID=64656 RepID=UPI0022FE0278|nr:uncharacterized protein BDB00DRAFT_280788 [Zychaea mexicana]KAI9494968.1 hypothetical protein BDB00DRAFT_280788 [Zychaea mexicana]
MGPMSMMDDFSVNVVSTITYPSPQQQQLPPLLLQQQEQKALERQFIAVAGPGLAELLLPHEDTCILIETDLGSRTRWRAERRVHSPLTDPFYKSTFFWLANAVEGYSRSSNQESILFCGDIVRKCQEHGKKKGRPSNRKRSFFVEIASGVHQWMPLWVKEKKWTLNEIAKEIHLYS